MYNHFDGEEYTRFHTSPAELAIYTTDKCWDECGLSDSTPLPQQQLARWTLMPDQDQDPEPGRRASSSDSQHLKSASVRPRLKEVLQTAMADDRHYKSLLVFGGVADGVI